MNQDEIWMQLALEQAGLGIGKTAPNPPVGAVIVSDGMLLGKGWHRGAGLPHAEREAIAAATADHGAAALIGATLFITLEPCSTHGRTPPCTDAIVEAGIRRVVYACADPNPAHAGRADEYLINAGITVVNGICRAAAENILRPFAKVQTSGLPWVILKIAMSLDGRITRPPGESPWITSAASRRDVQNLRAAADMIMTSGETVRRDKPALTIRVPELLAGRTQPLRLIVSRHPQSLPADAPLLCDDNTHRTLVREGDLESMLRAVVQEMGVLTVLVEAGGKLAAELLAAQLIDEIVIYMAPLITGGLPAVAGDGFSNVRLTNIEWTRIDEDVKLRASIDRG